MDVARTVLAHFGYSGKHQTENATAQTPRPPPTGKGTQVVVRLQPDLLAAIDAWIAEQDPSPTRAEALRRFAAKVLKTNTDL